MLHGRIARVAALCMFAVSAIAHANELSAVPGEFVVKLKPSTHVMSTMNLAATLGANVKSTINKKEGIILVQRPIVEAQATSVQALNQNPMVEYAEPNFIYKVVGGSTSAPTDGRVKDLWGLINTGQVISGKTGVAGIDVDASRAWAIETGSSDVLVAVIDTGVNYRNPDLASNIFVNTVEQNGTVGVDDDNNGCVDDIYGCDFANSDGDPMDVYGHGTHCAGTIGASNNGDGIVGVAWNVKILPVRFLGDDGSGTLANAIKSIDYATNMKVKIMSNSWGGGNFSQLLLDSINRAKDAGILFVAAAGNESNNNDTRPSYPATYQAENIISVAAIDSRGMMADFSSYGKTTVHLAAPGVDVLSYTMNGLEFWSGTSMATPHVSGVAALLVSQDQAQSYMTVKNRLLSSARKMSNLRSRVSTGLVNAYYALTNQVAPLDPNDPFNWQKTTEQISSAHPYDKNSRQEFTVSVPGAKKVAVYFSKFDTEGGYDKVTFTDANGKVFGSISGTLGETFSPVVDGDTVIITFTSDDSVQKYGFDIGGVAYQN